MLQKVVIMLVLLALFFGTARGQRANKGIDTVKELLSGFVRVDTDDPNLFRRATFYHASVVSLEGPGNHFYADFNGDIYWPARTEFGCRMLRFEVGAGRERVTSKHYKTEQKMKDYIHEKGMRSIDRLLHYEKIQHPMSSKIVYEYRFVYLSAEPPMVVKITDFWPQHTAEVVVVRTKDVESLVSMLEPDFLNLIAEKHRPANGTEKLVAGAIAAGVALYLSKKVGDLKDASAQLLEGSGGAGLKIGNWSSWFKHSPPAGGEHREAWVECPNRLNFEVEEHSRSGNHWFQRDAGAVLLPKKHLTLDEFIRVECGEGSGLYDHDRN